MSLPIQIVVGAGGINPAADTTDYNNPALAGIIGYVEKSGYGILGYENYQLLSTGGFRLLNGFTFTQDEVLFFVPTGANYQSVSNSYTNGFHYNKTVSALLGRLGWVQSGTPILNIGNLNSKSGRYFNDGSFHSLVTLNNIKSVMELANATDAQYNAYLEQLQKSIILRSLTGVFPDMEYISQSLLYRRNSASVTPKTNEGKFVGVKIKVPAAEDIAVQVDSVALLFDEDATFNIYVFNDAIEAPIYSKEVTVQQDTQLVVDLSDVILNHIGGQNHGGNFFIGYFQDDLGPARALNEVNTTPICNTVFGYSFIESTGTGVNFDRENISYSSQPGGLNLHVSVFKDHTYQITKKPFLFDNLLGLQMAAQVVEQILFSTRSNKSERILKEGVDQFMTMMELDGTAPISDAPVSTGLRKQIAQELKRLHRSFNPKIRPMAVSVC